MKKSLLLLKNHKMKLIKNLSKSLKEYYSDIKYLLINLNDMDTYLLLKPNEYLLNFKRAVISFQSVIQTQVYERTLLDRSYSIMQDITKEITDIGELLNYLHSLNRNRFCNRLAHCNECETFESLDFVKFELTLYNDSDNIIYEKKLSVYDFDRAFSSIEILEKIKKLYKPIYHKDKILRFDETMWNITDDFDIRNSTYGIFLPYTNSVSFFPSKYLIDANELIRSIYYNGTIILPEDTAIDSELIRSTDIWFNDYADYVEFFTYIQYYHQYIIMMSEFNDLNEIIFKYDYDAQVYIEVFTESHSIRCEEFSDSLKHPFTIKELIQLVMEE